MDLMVVSTLPMAKTRLMKRSLYLRLLHEFYPGAHPVALSILLRLAAHGITTDLLPERLSKSIIDTMAACRFWIQSLKRPALK
jgi:hypothetical protein